MPSPNTPYIIVSSPRGRQIHPLPFETGALMVSFRLQSEIGFEPGYVYIYYIRIYISVLELMTL